MITTWVCKNCQNGVIVEAGQIPLECPCGIKTTVGSIDCHSKFIGPLISMETEKPKTDPVDHPSHYTKHPSGIECITVTEHFNFNRGNAIKYIWRAGEKGDEIEDLKKAAWYIAREIQRVEGVKK